LINAIIALVAAAALSLAYVGIQIPTVSRL
jgi:hypothetical protein